MDRLQVKRNESKRKEAAGLVKIYKPECLHNAGEGGESEQRIYSLRMWNSGARDSISSVLTRLYSPHHYFDRFGIPLLMIDIPKENYLVYGGIVVRQFPLWGLGLGLALLVAVSFWRKIGAMLGPLALPLGLLAVAALFWLSHAAGVAAAHQLYSEQRRTDYSAYPRVQVWPKQETNPPAGSPVASDDLTKGCYRLLLHNQDRLFLVRPFKGAAAADLPMLIIP